jgi:hypothetical protein
MHERFPGSGLLVQDAGGVSNLFSAIVFLLVLTQVLAYLLLGNELMHVPGSPIILP